METVSTHTYAAPLDQLLTLGQCQVDPHVWPDYGRMGFGSEHVPELIRMATDPALLWSNDEGDQIWAPIHAWRVLGMLRAEKAVEPLLGLFVEYEDEALDWLWEELPFVFGRIGRAAIFPITRFVADRSCGGWMRAGVASGLKEIAVEWPETRDECVAVLVRLLDDRYEDEEFTGGVVCELMDLDAVEAAPAMERAFAEDRVDIGIPGDWEDVQVKLGLLPERLTPRPSYNAVRGFLRPRIVYGDLDRLDDRRSSKSAAKAAAKRKAQKAARKKNRRRK